MKTFNVPVTQFLRPNRCKEQVEGQLNEKYKPQYESLVKCGCRLTAEVLRTGEVSFCIEHPELGDFTGEVASNGPESIEKFNAMVARFDEGQFEAWKQELE
tara:strand:- start:177 stop:479 length:303 start_codon:yes stop_codon:yes gene_type:complete